MRCDISRTWGVWADGLDKGWPRVGRGRLSDRERCVRDAILACKIERLEFRAVIGTHGDDENK